MSTEANLEIPGEVPDLQHSTPSGREQAPHLEGKQTLAGTVQRNIQSSKTHALQAAGELKTAVEAKGRELLHVADELLHVADDKASEIRAKAESAYGEAKGQLKVLQQQTEQFVRDKPLSSVCIALGAGFVLGLLTRPRR